MTSSAYIMLIPDEAYMAARPKTKEHHLTIADFGLVDAIPPEGLARLRSTVQSLARYMGGPLYGTANGAGLFDAGNDGFAIVDLVDGMDTFHCRAFIERMFGDRRFGYTLDNVRIAYRHGFTPHITREYLNAEDDFYGKINPSIIDHHPITFTSIALWHGDTKYGVPL